MTKQESIEVNRPYSQKELQTNRDKAFRSLRIGNTRVHHKTCNHFYYVKENGRKEKEIKNSISIINNGYDDIGYCSVCWKFRKTPIQLKNNALKLVNSYGNEFWIPTFYLTYEKICLEIAFYKWLYGDIINS